MKYSMKFALLFAVIFALVLILGAGAPQITGNIVKAQTADLFFSEYIEGSSINKAIEIYNGTGGLLI